MYHFTYTWIFFELLFIASVYWSLGEAIFLYCCPDCPHCPTDAVQIDRVTWAVIKKYRLNWKEQCMGEAYLVRICTCIYVDLLYKYIIQEFCLEANWLVSHGIHSRAILNGRLQPRVPPLYRVFFEACVLTLTVLNFWKFTSYFSLKPLWSGMGEVVPARTSPTLHPPSPPTVHQLSRLAL